MYKRYYFELGVLDSQMGERPEIRMGRRRPELRLNLSTCYLDSRTRIPLDNRPRTGTLQAVTPYDRPNARQNTSSNLEARTWQARSRPTSTASGPSWPRSEMPLNGHGTQVRLSLLSFSDCLGPVGFRGGCSQARPSVVSIFLRFEQLHGSRPTPKSVPSRLPSPLFLD